MGMKACAQCGGSGKIDGPGTGKPYSTCPYCDGAGEYEDPNFLNDIIGSLAEGVKKAIKGERD